MRKITKLALAVLLCTVLGSNLQANANESAKIQSAYAINQEIEHGEEQEIVIETNVNKEDIEDVKLEVEDLYGETTQLAAKDIELGEGVLVFSHTIEDEAYNIYLAKKLVITFANGEEKELPVSTDETYVSYLVNHYESYATLDFSDEKFNISEYMEDLLGDTGAVAKITEMTPATVSDDLIIVLDAGHGGSDPGASGGGLYEKDLCLSIAQYCRDELSEYVGVKVYMTRETDVYLTIAERVAYANSVNADVLVSLHINSSTSTSAAGAEVYYPNTNYNSSVSTIGKNLSQQIQNKLVALGLGDRGIKTRNATSDKYPDGSVADYYGILRYSKNAGFPGLIVEHAFISNSTDRTSYLNSATKLKNLGVADATGIANYYGLTKQVDAPVMNYPIKVEESAGNSVTLSWSATGEIDGYTIYTSKNGVYKHLVDVTTTSYTDTEAIAGANNYYWVYPFRMYKGEYVVGECTQYAVSKPGTIAEISDLKSTSVAFGAKLSWSSTFGAKGYLVYGRRAGGAYEYVGMTSSTTLTDTKASNTKWNYYWVYPYYLNSNGGMEVVTTTKYTYGKALLTAAVTDLKCTSLKTGVHIDWSASYGAEGYLVYGRRASGDYEYIGMTTKGTTFTDTKASNTKWNYYWVYPYHKNANGEIVVGGTADYTYGKAL